MEQLFSSGRIVDLILAIIVIEALLVTVLALVGRGRSSAWGMVMNLAAGAALLLALRSVMTGADWRETAAWLAAAFLAHLTDLAQRMKAARLRSESES